MNENQKAAYITAMAACASIEAIGMASENQTRLARNEAVAYSQSAFEDLIYKYGIHHNAVIEWFK